MSCGVVSVQRHAVWPGHRSWYFPAANINSEMEGLAMAYLDDILLFSKTSEEHFDHIQRVLDRLKKVWAKVETAVSSREKR